MSHLEASEKKEDLNGLPLEQAGETSITSNDAERKVLSKFDKFVMPQMAILVLFAYLDRTNIGNLPLPLHRPLYPH
jgi:hypothetical protein